MSMLFIPLLFILFTKILVRKIPRLQRVVEFTHFFHEFASTISKFEYANVMLWTISSGLFDSNARSLKVFIQQLWNTKSIILFLKLSINHIPQSMKSVVEIVSTSEVSATVFICPSEAEHHLNNDL